MKTEARVEALVKDLKHIGNDAEELLKAASDDVSETARDARLRLKSALDGARESCSELQKKALNGARAADNVIRHNPYQTAGVAFGIGLLVGVLTMARRN
jgi:ElaB/YqjD/DUF883 family membrane-anchored ribosome-binding protein